MSKFKAFADYNLVVFDNLNVFDSLKTFLEKEKMLGTSIFSFPKMFLRGSFHKPWDCVVTSIFSFCHNVFHPLKDTFNVLINL